jgi:aspartyl-tRNA(Asn)/glutamyl-tRNA(Gln) amidotransferase subunit A
VFEGQKVDALLTPTSPSTALPLEDLANVDPVTLYMNDVMTIPANMAGIPAMSVPVRLSQEGLPVGLQLLANRYHEGAMLEVAGRLEGLWIKNKEEAAAEQEEQMRQYAEQMRQQS